VGKKAEYKIIYIEKTKELFILSFDLKENDYTWLLKKIVGISDVCQYHS
jgi:hypothetical protein